MRLFILLMAGVMVLSSGCDVNRVYEKNKDFSERIWLEDSVVEFNVNLEDASIPYNVYVNIRNGQSYPFYNLYMQYAIVDSMGREVAKNLENLILFEPKTGEPYGSGLGDVFDHQIPIVEDYYFPEVGDFKIRMQQYMRRDTLNEVYSVGVRVERAGAD